jgi:hypothetical protein
MFFAIALTLWLFNWKVLPAIGLGVDVAETENYYQRTKRERKISMLILQKNTLVYLK